ncbi:hypothetical protein ACEPPN_010662 [Leptodophora sp. 'Broadleaf-Isolate-01']
MAKPPRAGYGPLKRPNHLLALGIITFISVLLCWLAIGDKLDLMDIYLGAEEEDGKHAFATILLPPLNSSSDAHEVDQYLTSTRMLNYQLRHSKTTRSRREVPFLVIVTPDIVPWKRKLLEREGSTVIFAERISLGTEWIEPMAERWKDVMLKLRLFELTDYDKILFLDADTYLLKPRTESSETPPLGLPKPESLRRKFDLTKLLFLNNRFDSTYPEQNLLNYAHREWGNMPWTHLKTGWNVNLPNMNDVKKGVRSVHAKLWAEGNELQPVPEELRRMWEKTKVEMESFYGEMGHRLGWLELGPAAERSWLSGGSVFLIGTVG